MNLAAYAAPALVTLAMLALVFGCAVQVGRMRGRHRIDAPAMTGHPEMDIAVRVHANTVENALLVVPALWLAALFFSPAWAAAAGAVWVAARLWFALAYLRDPKRRGGGFLGGLLAWAALMLMAAWGALRVLLG